MMNTQFLPIVLPAAWTKEKDIREFTECFGDDAKGQCRYCWIIKHLAESYERYEHVLDEALAYFNGTTHPTDVLLVKCFSVPEKIQRLSTYLENSGKDAEYKSRFGEILGYYSWLSTEVPRIIDQEMRKDQQWLHSFHHASDHLVTAATELEEVMQIEHSLTIL